MKKTVAIVGATGNLGGRIVKALSGKEARILALVRKGTEKEKSDSLKQAGADVIEVDMTNKAELTSALSGASVVVSALQGLHDVIVDAQTDILEAAIAAGVPRFIPSDFSVDFTDTPKGENRNFDIRHEFYDRINEKPIKATSIFNGAFADILGYSAPFVDMKNKSIGYWNSPDWKVDVTSMDDTAAYTAAAALDDEAPRKLLIAGFQISAKELQQLASKVFNTTFGLKDLGSTEALSAHNKAERAAHPEGENQLYASWQGSQYMYSMFTRHHNHLDNDRYPGIHWTDAKTVLSSLKKQ